MKHKDLTTFSAILKSLFFIFLSNALFAQTNINSVSAAGAVTEQHKMLARSNGTWIGEALVWYAPDKPPITSTSLLTNYMDSNGLFQISEVRGNVTGGGTPFTGIRITGYDTVRKVFTRAMIGDGSPGVAMEGKWDEATKSFSMPFTKTDESGKEKKLKEVYTFVNGDEEILEIYDMAVSANAKAFRVLKVTWRRTPIPRIGYLSGAGVMHLENVFMDELKKLGFREGENVKIEMRLARPNTEDLKVMATELAGMDLAVIVAASLPIALEIRKNNPKMPIVLATCPGMVSNGFAKSLEHPGGIYTGMDELPEGVTAKRLQLLKAAVPNAKRIALLSATPGVGGHEVQLAEAETTAPTLGVAVKPYRVTSLEELKKALMNIKSDGMNGVLVFQGALTLANREMVVDFAAQNRLPVIYQQSVFVEVGGLMAWAPDLEQQFREAAHFVEKILKGAKPGDLPVKHPDKYYLTLNETAAGKIGVKFPEELLAEATKVITQK